MGDARIGRDGYQGTDHEDDDLRLPPIRSRDAVHAFVEPNGDFTAKVGHRLRARVAQGPEGSLSPWSRPVKYRRFPKHRIKPHNPVKQSFHHVRSSLHARPCGGAANQSEEQKPGNTPRPAPPPHSPRNALFLLISVRAVVPSSSDANGSAPSSSSRGTTSGLLRAAP